MPKYSLLIAARDDDWESSPGNRPIDRLSVTLCAIQAGMEHIDAECIVIDWGSKTPIGVRPSDLVIVDPRFRVVRASPEVAASCGSSFSEVHALNLAARAASGQYLARLDNDTFPGPTFFDWLAKDGPQPGHAYWANRRDMTRGCTVPRGDEPVTYPPDGPECWRWHVGVLMMERAVWHELRGYDEDDNKFAHMEHGLLARLARRVKLINLGLQLGCPFFHQWHTRRGELTRPKNKFLSVEELRELPLVANNENWGLRREFPQFD